MSCLTIEFESEGSMFGAVYPYPSPRASAKRGDETREARSGVAHRERSERCDGWGLVERNKLVRNVWKDPPPRRSLRSRRPQERASVVSTPPLARARGGGMRAACIEFSLPPGESNTAIRSARLTIFWHCDFRHFSSKTALERSLGNEPSTVLPEDLRSTRVWQC
jgi:hypothetical protein